MIKRHAPLAQLDRASGYGPEGQGFESLTACQKGPSHRDGPFWHIWAEVRDSNQNRKPRWGFHRPVRKPVDPIISFPLLPRAEKKCKRIPYGVPENAIPRRGVAFFAFSGGFEPEGTWQGAGGALQPEVACAAAQVESLSACRQINLFCLPGQKRFSGCYRSRRMIQSLRYIAACEGRK